MSIPSGKKILLTSFILILLLAIPITVYLVQQQQKTQSSAVAATTLTLSPASQTTTVGNTISFDVNVDPSTNLVSFVKLSILYDATKLAKSDAGLVVSSWKGADGATFTPTILQGPTYGTGTISVTISIGVSPQNAIQKPTKIATVSFNAIGATDTAPTQITFDNQTQVRSLGSSDQFSENVLSTTNPASVNILAVNSPTPTPTATPTPTPTPTATPTTTPTSTPTATPTTTPTPTPTPTTTTQQTSSDPVCSSLTLDRSTTGTAPYSVNLTLTGSSLSSTISKATFNFGDGQSLDVNQAGGIGTNSVSILQSHVYQIAGTFTATGTLTNANGNVSSGGCSIVITANTPGASPTVIVQNPSPLPSTGPSEIVTIGAIGAVLAIAGAILLFAL